MKPGGRPDSNGGLSVRQQEIVGIARATFATRGYRNTSMRDIADSAGLMPGSLYSHFKSKSEIMRLVAEPLLDRLQPAQQAALDAGDTGLDQLERMIRNVLAVIVDSADELTILHYDWSDLVGMDGVDQVVARSRHLLDLWHAAITAGMADGSIRADLEPELLIRSVTSSLHAVVDMKRYDARTPPLTRASVDGLADQLVTLFLSGLRAPAPGATPAPRRRPAKARRPG